MKLGDGRYNEEENIENILKYLLIFIQEIPNWNFLMVHL